MKRILPKTFSKGFTLIELLVVVAIIAIISVVAIALFSNAQQDTRDGKRKAELEQIANVLEINRTSTTPVGYQNTSNVYWGGNVYPGGNTAQALDPQGYPYCISYSYLSTTMAAEPTLPLSTSWDDSPVACITGVGGTFYIVGNAGTSGSPPTSITPGTITAYRVCTRLENRSSAKAFCRINVQ